MEKPNFLTYFLEKGFIKLGKPNQKGRKGFTIEFEGHHAREMAVLKKEQTSAAYPARFCHSYLFFALPEKLPKKTAKMALFDPCMEFDFLGQMTSYEVLLKCHSLTLSKKCLRLCPAPSNCLSERINRII